EYHQVEPEQVMVTNGSMQADAFLFGALVEAGDAAVAERPTDDRTLLSLPQRGADRRLVELEPAGIAAAALGRRLDAAPRPKIAAGTYISPSMVAQAIVHQFCLSGALERSIETVKVALRERAKTLCEALRSELPEARFVEPEGGYFLWLDLPEGADVDALFRA